MSKKTNKTRYALLGTLSLGDKSGYDIKKFIEGSLGNFWSESYGQIYPILKELEAEGLATKATEGGRGKSRNVYAITPNGLAELREWLKEHAEFPTVRNERLLKLFFGSEVPLRISIEHVRQAEREIRETLARYEQIEQQISPPVCDHPSAPYWLLTLRYGRKMMMANLEWCEEALETLQALEER